MKKSFMFVAVFLEIILISLAIIIGYQLYSPGAREAEGLWTAQFGENVSGAFSGF